MRHDRVLLPVRGRPRNHLAVNGIEDIEECHLLQSSGDALDLIVHTSPFSVEGEGFVIAAILDVSNEKRRHALERVFCHDLLNLIGNISLLADNIDYLDADDSARVLKNIRKGVLRASEEIRSQQQLLLAEASELTPEPQALSSGAFLDETIGNCLELAQSHGIGLKLNDGSKDVAFTSDPSLLGRVVMNMIKNAIEACNEGDIVTVNCDTDGATVSFSVHNPGFIPRPIQLQLFQRSFTTKGKGRGLGTYSMRLLTNRYLQGNVTFESTKDNGTTFTATYPLAFQTTG